jgi:transposase
LTSTVDLKPFYPEYIEIEEIEDFDNENIHIHMKSLRLTSRCPECGEVSGRVHSLAARRNIRDLPILDKGVLITIKSRKFFCENEGCRTRVFTESMDKFIGIRWKWTHRCEEFIVAVAMNTSCEAASKICGLINAVTL